MDKGVLLIANVVLAGALATSLIMNAHLYATDNDLRTRLDDLQTRLDDLQTELNASQRELRVWRVFPNSLLMTIETDKSTVVVGEPLIINVSVYNLGTEDFKYSAPSLNAPDTELCVSRIGGEESYYALHYRWMALFSGIGDFPVVTPRKIPPMKTMSEIHYAKFLGVGEFNVTASFLSFDISVIVNVINADDIEVTLENAINLVNKGQPESCSLIRSESLEHPIWILRFGSRNNFAVDAVQGSISQIPTSLWDMAILEMLEYQSPYKYMHLIIGATTDFTPTMIAELEEFGAKNVNVLGTVIAKDTVSADVPCDYNKIIGMAGLWFVDNFEGLMSVSDDC